MFKLFKRYRSNLPRGVVEWAIFHNTPCARIANKIMAGLNTIANNKIYALSSLQNEALHYAFLSLFVKIYEPLINQLTLARGMSPKKKIIGKIKLDILDRDIKEVSFKILNTSNSFGPNTKLELQVPISVIYLLYVEFLCDHFKVLNDKPGRKSLRSYLSKSQKSQKLQIISFIKTLSKTDLLAISQQCDGQIKNQLLFSINSIFSSEDVVFRKK